MTFKARVPLAAFRVPDGKIAMTLKLHGTKCMTATIGVGDLDLRLSRFEIGTGIDAADRASRRTYAQICELLGQYLERGEDADMSTCVAAGFWLALNHPHASATMRMQVAAFIRMHNRVQVTITSDHRRLWSFAVSERPAMPEAVMAMMPIGSTVYLTLPGRAYASPGH